MSVQDEVSFSFLAEHTSDIVCRAALDMTLQYVSPSVSDLLGWQPVEMVGRSLNFFVSEEEALSLASAAGTTYAPVLEKAAVTLRVQKRDGTFLWMEIRRRLLLDSGTGEPLEYVVLMRDAGRMGVAEDEPSPVMFTQQISGLATFSEFHKDLEREWSRAHREGSPISLLRLDFNGFRQFHFLDGHRVGDGCLAKAAATIKGLLRLTDFAAEYLAEDIVILLPCTDEKSAAKVAAKVRAEINALRSPRSIEGKAWATVSIGIATATAKSAGSPRIAEILLLSAEHALQRAQQQEAESLRRIAAYSARNTDWKNSMPGAPPRCA